MEFKSSRNLFMNLITNYGLTNKEKKEFLKITYKIFKHKEFQRRMTKEFSHHNDITVGEHSIEVALSTYLISKKLKLKEKKFNIKVSVISAMLHDMYELPWQNNKEASSKHLFHKHGFRHPIEAAINAVYYYPELFKDDEEAFMIIDAIIHHMYPLVVPVIKNFDINELELKNYDKVKFIDDRLLNYIVYSSNRCNFGKLSICMSKFKEGKIVCTADTKVSIHNFEKLKGITALFTGVNNNIKA